MHAGTVENVFLSTSLRISVWFEEDTGCKTCVADPLCMGAVYLSESFCTNSSDKLSVPQPGGHVTTGVLTIEHVQEIFVSHVGLGGAA